ncbi:MAG: type II secretion system protein M [Azoarcus sp.]|jgi:hypothetical protein|nr:type II secretion system protein M [Azoarcus sp.]
MKCDWLARLPLRLPHSRAGLTVGLSILVALAPFLFVAALLAQQWFAVRDALVGGEPRLARLLGLREAADDVRRAREAAESALAAAAYAGETPADRLGTELQQRLRVLGDAAGVSISGSQVIDGKEENGFQQIVVAMSFEATHEQLQQLLQALVAQTPAVFVDNLVITSQRFRADAKNRLSVRARFSALRQQP